MSLMYNKLARFINDCRAMRRRVFTRKIFYHAVKINDELAERANYSQAIHAFIDAGVIQRWGSRSYVIMK